MQKENLIKFLTSMRMQFEMGLKYYDYIRWDNATDNLNKACNSLLDILFEDDIVDLLVWWLYEDVEKIIYYQNPKGKDEIEEDLSNVVDFVNYLFTIQNLFKDNKND